MRGTGEAVLGTSQDPEREPRAAPWEPVCKHPVSEDAHAL